MMVRKNKKFIAFCLLIGLVGFFYWMGRQEKTSQPTGQAQTTPLEHSIKHLALIMDGNRRWARKQGLEAWRGHEKGTEPVKVAVEFCLQQQIPYLTLYTFSLENFKRSPEELEHLFTIIKKGLLADDVQKLFEHGVKIRFVGDRSKFPADLIQTITDLEKKTANGTKLLVNILFCYGGQQEIAAAMQKIGEKIARNELKPEAITPELITQYIWMGDVPCPDLMIRTGGEQRLSNFLTWQCGYGELMFLDCYWPDITTEHLANAVKEFETRKRRFGK
jgi:undecaprenyl diphosphate synthase